MLPQEINILIGNGIIETDRNSFFGPLKEDDEFQVYESSITFADLLVKNKFFTSKGDARRNGWNKDVPAGFTDLFVGKFKRRLTILKIL